MNHTYRVVYHQASNTYIAVSELTTHKTKSSKTMMASAAVAALGLTQQAQAVVTVSSNHSNGVITSGVSATSMTVVAVPSLSVKQKITAKARTINFDALNAANATTTHHVAHHQTQPKAEQQKAEQHDADEEIINTVRVAVPANDDVNVQTTAATAAADSLPKEPTASKRAAGTQTDTENAADTTQANTTAVARAANNRLMAYASPAAAMAGPSEKTTTGVNVDVNGSNVALEAGSTLNLVNGQGTVVKVDNTAATPTVKIDTPMSYVNQAGETTETPSNAVKLVGADAKKPVTLHNIEAGVATTDAVNVGQLRQTQQQMDQKIAEVADDAKAGTAAALAAAGLTQAYVPGKNMVSIAGSTYRGKQGYAVGFSTITDSGSWVFKGAATGHSQGYFGATIGAGYQW